MAGSTVAHLVWVDCEMTGLDPAVDELVEVAVVITDYDLNPVDEGFQVVIKPSTKALEQMNDFVRDMHATSGLLDQLEGGVDLAEAEAQVLAYIQQYVPDAQSAPLAGNTIGTDRMFLQKYMPQVHEHLHYRNIDVSTIKELSKQCFRRRTTNHRIRTVGTEHSRTFSNRFVSWPTTVARCLWMLLDPPPQN